MKQVIHYTMIIIIDMVYADNKVFYNFIAIGGEERGQSYTHLHFARISPNRRYCCWLSDS